jgi:hypothetical protein
MTQRPVKGLRVYWASSFKSLISNRLWETGPPGFDHDHDYDHDHEREREVAVLLLPLVIAIVIVIGRDTLC